MTNIEKQRIVLLSLAQVLLENDEELTATKIRLLTAKAVQALIEVTDGGIKDEHERSLVKVTTRICLEEAVKAAMPSKVKPDVSLN